MEDFLICSLGGLWQLMPIYVLVSARQESLCAKLKPIPCTPADSLASSGPISGMLRMNRTKTMREKDDSLVTDDTVVEETAGLRLQKCGIHFRTSWCDFRCIRARGWLVNVNYDNHHSRALILAWGDRMLMGLSLVPRRRLLFIISIIMTIIINAIVSVDSQSIR